MSDYLRTITRAIGLSLAFACWVSTSPGQEAGRAAYDNDAQFQMLSGAGRSLLESKFGPKPVPKGQSTGYVPDGLLGGPAPAAPLENNLVNNPGLDTTEQDTQSESTLVLGANGRIIAGFNDSGSFLAGLHFTGYSLSDDDGATWLDRGILPTSNGGDSGDPVLARGLNTVELDDTIYFATLMFSGSGIQVFRSLDNGSTFNSAINAAPEFGGGDFLDKPWMTVDNYPGEGQGYVYVTFTNFEGGGAGSRPQGIYLTRSTNGGLSWAPEDGLLISGVCEQGSYVTVGPDHAVYVFYWDCSGFDQRIMVRKSLDLGVTFDPPVTVATLRTTGVNGGLGLNGGFRSNAFPQAVVNPVTGDLYVIFNDATEGIDDADVFFTQSTDGGLTWSVPQRVNDDATTNDQWQPALAVTPDGTRLFVGFYDRRLDPANSLIDVFGVIGQISGSVITFGENFRITTESFPVVIGQDPVVNTTYMGDYDVAVADDDYFYYTWADNRLANSYHDNQPDIRFTRIPVTGVGVLSFHSASVSGGNGNGVLDPNECVDLTVVLTNRTATPITGEITAVLSTRTLGVTITQDLSSYPPINPGESGANTLAFQVVTTPVFPCGKTIEFELLVKTSGEGTFSIPFQLVTGSPTLGTPLRFDNSEVVDIPDQDTIESSNLVSGVSGPIGDVTVSLYLTHTFDSDLEISLIAPDGTEVLLSSNNGLSGDNYGIACSPDGDRTAFDDAAGSSITSGTAPFLGTFRPEGRLADLQGKDANGLWRLRVRDAQRLDVGTLNCWSLFIAPTDCESGSGPCTPIPLLCLSADEVDFGSVQVGAASDPISLVVTNCGTADLEISSLMVDTAVEGEFAIQSEDCTTGAVAPGESCMVDLVFVPTLSGLRVGELVIENNAGAPQYVPLTGQGVICSQLFITPLVLPSPSIGVAYGYTNTVSGGAAPYQFIRTAGSLPPDMALTLDGVISGTPTALGTYEFKLMAIDENGCMGQRFYALQVVCPVKTFSPSSLPVGQIGVPYAAQLIVSGGQGPFTLAVTGGSMPEGLSLSSDGEISGTPTSVSSTFVVTATDSYGCPGSRSYTIVLADPPPEIIVTPPMLPSATVGEAYVQSLAATGGSEPYTYSVTAGSLPAGLSLSAGAISGTPTSAGAASFTVTAEDTQGHAGSTPYTLEVGAAPPYRPDAMIKLAGTTTFVGRKVFSSTGRDQIATTTVTAGEKAVLFMKVRNAGTAPDSYRLWGRGDSAGFTVRYSVGGVDVTDQVVAGTYETAVLAPGESTLSGARIKVEVTVDPSVASGALKRVKLKAYSAAEPALFDAVKAKVFVP